MTYGKHRPSVTLVMGWWCIFAIGSWQAALQFGQQFAQLAQLTLHRIQRQLLAGDDAVQLLDGILLEGHPGLQVDQDLVHARMITRIPACLAGSESR